MKPSIGRIVHYVCPDTKDHLPAIITGVIDQSRVNVFVMQNSWPNYSQHPQYATVLMETRPQWKESARYDAACSHGTWHWPEREES